MSLSSLFNLPTAPTQLLSDNSVGGPSATNSANGSSSTGGDAFATYMAQQMSSGQFSNWQNLTSALASQSSLNAQPTGFAAATQNFAQAPASWVNHTGSQSHNASSVPPQAVGSSDSAGVRKADTPHEQDASNTAHTGTASSNNPALHRKPNSHLGTSGLPIDGADGSDDTDSSGDAAKSASSAGAMGLGESSTTNTLYSTSALLMGAGLGGGPLNQSSAAAGASNAALGMQAQQSGQTVKGLSSQGNEGAALGADGTAANGLPIVLPSIGAALLAQQNALRAKDAGHSGGAVAPDGSGQGLGQSIGDLKTVTLSPQIDLITPAQSNTSPQSLISFARSMGLSDPQVHQLFGADATSSAAQSTNATHFASTESLINTTGALPSASASAGSANAVDPGGNLSVNNAATDVSLSSANAVLSQTSNLQIQIDQAPGATGIQSQATAGTLADLNSQVSTASVAGAIGGSSLPSTSSQASTLEVLSVMEASLRPEDVDALQAHFTNTGKSSSPSLELDQGLSVHAHAGADVNLSGLSNDASGAGFGGSDSNNSNNGAGNSSNSDGTQTNATLPSDMAAAYEKLSNKFATEVSNRLQQQFAQGQWKMKFALRPSSLGFVDVQLEMKDGKLAANFQSDNALTQSLIQNNSHQLRDALQSSGIAQSSVQVGSGQTSGQGSGQNSGVPYTPVTQAQTSEAQGTEEIATSDDSNQRASSTSSSQLDILA